MRPARFGLYPLINTATVAFAIAFSAVHLTGRHAYAADRFWIDPGGGAFSDPTNWIPAAVPDDTDTVFFQVPGTYEVTLPNDVHIDALDIDDNAGPIFRAQSVDPVGLTRLTIDTTLDVLDSRLTFDTLGDRRLEVDVNGPINITGFANDDTRNVLTVLDKVTFKADNTVLGKFPGRLGRLVVSGTDATWDMTARNLDMGTNDGIGGGGELLIEAGGEFVGNRVSLGSGLPNANNSNRTSVHVTGVGTDGQPSTLNSKLFDVATFGLGSLRIDGGAHVIGETTSVGTQFGEGFGIIDVVGTDATGNPSLWRTGTLLANDFDGPGFRILDGGRVESTQVLIEEASEPIVIDGTGTNGVPSTWSVSDLLTLGRRLITTVEVRDGGRFETEDVEVGVVQGALSEVLLSNSAPGVIPTTAWFSSGDVTVGSHSSSGTGVGEVTIPAGTEFGVGGQLTVAPVSRVTLDGGTLFLGEYDPDDPDGGGDLELLAGKLEFDRILGDFTLENVTLSPADDLGVAGILGNYSQDETGTLLFELAGSTAGQDFDQLTVTGFADLGGTLAVELRDGFTPDSNDAFTIFATAVLAGTFDNVLPGQRLTTVDGRGSFVVNYGLGSPAPTGQILLSDFIANALLSGDYNGNGQVEQGDLDLVLQNWGDDTTVTGVPSGWVSDLPEGQIDQAELDGVLQNWGATAAPGFVGNVVPEPAAFGVLAGMSACFLRRRTSVSTTRPREATVVLATAATIATSAYAQDVHEWDEPTGGVYGTVTHWDPVGVPSPLDTARFGINGDYTVSFNQDRQVRQLQIVGGDVVFEGAGILADDPAYTVENLVLNAGELFLQRGINGKGVTLESTTNTNIRGGLFVQDGTRLQTGAAILDRTGAGIGGRVFVTGTGPGGEISSWSAEQLFIGNVGRGEVRVDDGAFVDVETNTVLGSVVGSVGELTVAGTGFFTGSAFRSDGNLVIGQSGTGRLSVEAGGSVYARVTTLGALGGGLGLVRVSGGGADWGTDSLFVDRGDVLVETGGTMRSLAAAIGRDGPSSVVIDGPGSTWDAESSILLGFNGDVLINVLNGGTVTPHDVVAGEGAGATARINLSSADPENPTRWHQSRNLHLGGDGIAPNGRGIFNVLTNAEATIDGRLNVGAQGEALLNPGGSLAVQTIDHRFGGRLDLNGGEFYMRQFLGDLTNTGATFSPFTGDPRFAERDAGMSTIIGDYRQQANAALLIDIVDHSLGCGIGYDHVAVNGDAILGGTLDIQLLDGFVPDAEEAYDVLMATAISGQFANAAPGDRVTTADGLGSFLVSYGPTSAFDPNQVFLSDFIANTLLSGDYNGNGQVEQGDLDLVLQNWGNDTAVTGVPNGWVNDLPDGQIDQAELDLVLQNWGSTAAPSFSGAGVPEPTSLVLLLTGGISAIRAGRTCS